MKAKLLFYRHRQFDDGGLSVIRIWEVPKPVPPSTHGLKYSLFYGFPGQRRVCYDNERGKGDHRHIEGREEPYIFVSVERLIADFLSDVNAARGKR